MGKLKGKKTYIMAVLGVIGAAAGWAVGDMSGVQALQAVWAAVVAATLRNGMSMQ